MATEYTDTYQDIYAPSGISQAVSTESAQPLTVIKSKLVILGRATETSLAQAVEAGRRRSIGLAVTVESALAVTVVMGAKLIPVGTAVATEQGLALTVIVGPPPGRTLAIGVALESSLAHALAIVLGEGEGLAPIHDTLAYSRGGTEPAKSVG